MKRAVNEETPADNVCRVLFWVFMEGVWRSTRERGGEGKGRIGTDENKREVVELILVRPRVESSVNVSEILDVATFKAKYSECKAARCDVKSNL